MKIKKDNEVQITFDEFKEDFLMKSTILFTESYDSFVMCTPTGEALCNINILFDSNEEKEDFIKMVKELDY